MKKLFILSSLPPCGSAPRLSYDYNFLMLQMEHKMLMTLASLDGLQNRCCGWQRTTTAAPFASDIFHN